MPCSTGQFLSLKDGKIDVVQKVIRDVCIIRPKARVPTVEKRSIIPTLENLLETYRKISHNKCRKGTIYNIKNKGDTLRKFETKLNYKISKRTLFLTDQRTEKCAWAR